MRTDSYHIGGIFLLSRFPSGPRFLRLTRSRHEESEPRSVHPREEESEPLDRGFDLELVFCVGLMSTFTARIHFKGVKDEAESILCGCENGKQ